MDPLIGALVSHYRVMQQIGAGGMGVVYLAEDERLHRKVALKFITPASAGDAAAQKRLLHEAQAASALDHPNIATVYEVGDYGDQLFIAMAYYGGETLKQRLEHGVPSLLDTLAIVEHVAEGLASAHAAGVIHRDLKPANIFLTTSGQVKILDFGLAKVECATSETTAATTATGTTFGTVSYMAPEQARGLHVDQRADLWALGVIVFEMLTGRLPFTGTTTTAILLALANETPPSVHSLRRDAPPAISRLVERALTKDPDHRAVSAADFVHTAAESRARLSTPTTHSVWRALKRPAVAIPLVALVVATSAVAIVGGRRWLDRRWALYTALPEIVRLADQQEFVKAMDLAAEAAPLLENDAQLAALWPRISRAMTVDSTPAGAAISFRPYPEDASWRSMGNTPLKDIRVPLGIVHVRAEKAGFLPAEDLSGGFGGPPAVSFTLAPEADTPAGMVRVAPVRGNFSIYVFGLETPRVKFNGFWIDRYEVTNKEFKAFVDAGGYRRRELWKHPFTDKSGTHSFDEAMTRFRDQTGRPGPATWTLGTYSAGQDAMPVTGVSWFEAAAYAAFVGKELPTIYHWYWVANQALAGTVIPLGTFNAKGPVPVTTTRALHRFGAYGLAGNVKEWCFNDAPDHQRYILGGGWDEPGYLFRDADARSPFERGANMGFRTAKYDSDDASVAAVSGLVRPPSRSYEKETPASDEVFQAYRRLYSYDPTDLVPKVEAVDESNPDWRLEKVSFAAGYGQERMLAYIFVPTNAAPPYQTVVFMPGSGAWDQRTSPPVANPQYGFLVRSGRAVAVPVYKGAWERSTPEYHGGDQLKSTNVWRDYVIFFAKDISRTLDYLATRSEFDAQKIGFFGFSRGAALSPVMLTAEPRIKVAALWIPGLYLEQIHPEVDAINFAPRVKMPVLQLNGRYDFNFPPEASSDPFYRTLGTAPEHKRRVMYDTGHNLPPNEAIKETLDWFDRYLGPPR